MNFRSAGEISPADQIVMSPLTSRHECTPPAVILAYVILLSNYVFHNEGVEPELRLCYSLDCSSGGAKWRFLEIYLCIDVGLVRDEQSCTCSTAVVISHRESINGTSQL